MCDDEIKNKYRGKVLTVERIKEAIYAIDHGLVPPPEPMEVKTNGRSGLEQLNRRADRILGRRK